MLNLATKEVRHPRQFRYLLEDARRDWTAIGGVGADIQPLSNWPLGRPIGMGEGVLFVPYATLRSQRETDSRLAQILAWAGADFDGVIAFDEAHAMGGVAGGETSRGKSKGSEQGIAGVTLQDKLPGARVLYASATGASSVTNLAYAVRLGLWGPETDFPTRELFISEIAVGGIAAMEVVARDLKSMGLYTARALSFGGVEYEMLEHPLSADQIATYDRYAEAWAILCAAAHKMAYREVAIMRRSAARPRKAAAHFATSFALFHRVSSHSIRLASRFHDGGTLLAAGAPTCSSAFRLVSRLACA